MTVFASTASQGGIDDVVCQASNGEIVHLNHVARQTLWYVLLRTVETHLYDNGVGSLSLIIRCGLPSAAAIIILTEEAKGAGRLHTDAAPLILAGGYACCNR